MTGQTLINYALLDLGVIAGDETPSATESANNLVLANQILSSWSVEGATVYTQLHGTFVVTFAQSSYTIGVGGSWNTAARPMRIVGAMAYYGNFQNGLEILSFPDFRKRVKNPLGITSNLPDLLAFDNASPTENVRLYPTPNTSCAIEVDYWTALTQIATLATVISLPEGYELALRHALAVAAAPSYGKEVSQTLAANAQSSKAAIVQLNSSINAPRQEQQAQQ